MLDSFPGIGGGNNKLEILEKMILAHRECLILAGTLISGGGVMGRVVVGCLLSTEAGTVVARNRG